MRILKYIIIILAHLITFKALAISPESKISLICVTEFPTTSYEASQENDLVKMRFIHHNGVQFIPFFDSILTPHDLTDLKEQADMVQKLGTNWEFYWKRSGCNADSPTFFQCVGEAVDFEINGIKIHPWALTVTDVEQKNMWGTYKHKNVNLKFSVEKKNYQITMDYQPKECVPLQ